MTIHTSSIIFVANGNSSGQSNKPITVHCIAFQAVRGKKYCWRTNDTAIATVLATFHFIFIFHSEAINEAIKSHKNLKWNVNVPPTQTTMKKRFC